MVSREIFIVWYDTAIDNEPPSKKQCGNNEKRPIVRNDTATDNEPPFKKCGAHPTETRETILPPRRQQPCLWLLRSNPSLRATAISVAPTSQSTSMSVAPRPSKRKKTEGNVCEDSVFQHGVTRQTCWTSS